jgi:riboflavin kinase/FMN adenylyltransferase
MRTYEGSAGVGEGVRGCVLTIGNFDGLHVGHAALLRAVRERGRELGAATGVYTFDPHPRRVLMPERPVPLLMTWDQLALGVEGAGIDFLVRETFTEEFAARTAENFLGEVIRQRLGPAELFVGRDFHFGKGASGSDETLGRIGPTLGIRVTIIPQVRVDGRDVSSTRVRELLREGEVEIAASYLGRPYTIWGTVVEGDRRGRTLGFPTANLEADNELIPANGVYAGTVQVLEQGRPAGAPLAAVTNVGTRPTFDSGRVLAEAHLLDWDGDLYGQRLELSFHARIRAERRFDGPDQLAAQIRRDAEQARVLLAPTGG